MSHGFVEQNAGPAGTQHHGHFAGRRLHRIQHDHGLAGGFGGEVLGGLLFEEKVERDATAAAGLPALRLAAILPRQGRHVQARLRLPVDSENSFAGCHHHLAEAVGVEGLHLENTRIVGARRPVRPLHQLHAIEERGLGRRGEHGVQIMRGAIVQTELFDLAGTRGDGGRHARRLSNPFRREIVAICVPGAPVRNHPHPHAHGDALGGALDHGFIYADGAGEQVFEVQVRVVAPLGKRIRQVAFQVPSRDVEARGEYRLGKLHDFRLPWRSTAALWRLWGMPGPGR